MPDGETPSPNAPATDTAQPRGGQAVTLALATHRHNPVRIAKVMQREIDRLRDLVERGNLPPGAVLLKGEDAAAWAEYRALGKPADVKAAVTERDTLKREADQRTARDARLTKAEQAAAALGWNVQATRTFVDDKGFALELRETDVPDGRGGTTKATLPYVVTGTGADQKAELLSAAVQRDHAVYLPALTAAATAAPTAASPASTGGAPAPAPTTGPRYVPQAGVGTPPAEDDPIARRVAARNHAAATRPNPLTAAGMPGYAPTATPPGAVPGAVPGAGPLVPAR